MRPINADLSPYDVQLEVTSIKRKAGDPEAAHAAEDALHRMVLVQIADMDVGLASRLAECALLTREIEFDRWYA